MTPAAMEQNTVPLCVDLDGTVIRTDLLWESMVQLLKRNPLYLFLLPFWWMRGRAYLKAQIAGRTKVDLAALPCDQAFLEYIREQRKAGRRLILVTASDVSLAQQFGRALPLFDEIIASNGSENLRGSAKAARLVERFGAGGFDYAGNSSVDYPVWQKARLALVVNARESVEATARRTAKVSHVFEGPKSKGRAWLGVLRPHQWVKNLILFVPLVTSHQITKPALLGKTSLAFVAFCFFASAMYVLNDLFDLESDRHHPTKKNRPFASGWLPPQRGFAALPILLVLGTAVALLLPWQFLVTLALYLVIASAYSFRLKQVVLLDAFLLAGLYTVRLVGGHTATGIRYSVWLLAFSMFLFLSLALVKRFQELLTANHQQRVEIRGRGYLAGDLGLVMALGTSSGYIAVLVLALYVNSAEVLVLYKHPTLLLLICPLLLFWISRVWLLTHRGLMHEDPIVFALTDRVSYAVGVLTLLVIWLATGV